MNGMENALAMNPAMRSSGILLNMSTAQSPNAHPKRRLTRKNAERQAAYSVKTGKMREMVTGSMNRLKSQIRP